MRRRPTFINLLLIKLPIPAISSISHRATGIINFFITIPTFVFLFLTGFLLDESNSWDTNKFNVEIKVLISVSLVSITYHIFSGLRHLIIDFSNYGHEIEQARTSAIVVFLFTILLSFFLIMEVW